MGQTLQSSMREEGKVTVQGNFHQVEDLVEESDRSALKIKRGNGEWSDRRGSGPGLRVLRGKKPSEGASRKHSPQGRPCFISLEQVTEDTAAFTTEWPVQRA